MVLTPGTRGKSAEIFHKGGDYVAVTLLARMENAEKSWKHFGWKRPFTVMFLKQI